MNFNQNGFLEPGLHTCKMCELEEKFVNQFPASQTRRMIYEQFCIWIKNLVKDYKICEIWLDGSFVTKKTNPNDVDLVVFVHINDYIKLATNWKNVRNVPLIDAYMTLAICDESKVALSPSEYNSFVNNRNYWRGQFGFDRTDAPKGFLIINEEELSLICGEGGDSACR